MPPVYLLLQFGLADESVVFVPYALKVAQSPVLVVAPHCLFGITIPS